LFNNKEQILYNFFELKSLVKRFRIFKKIPFHIITEGINSKGGRRFAFDLTFVSVSKVFSSHFTSPGFIDYAPVFYLRIGISHNSIDT